MVEIARLVKHAEYLRQINSNKAFSCQRKARWMTIATVAVAAAVAFVGFAGTDELRQQLNGPLGWSQQAVDLSYNSLVLVVLLLTIVSLVYRLPERAVLHEDAIRSLTEFIRPFDAVVRAVEAGARSLTLLDSIEAEQRYLMMTKMLPPSTDKEFLNAKRDYAMKRKKSKLTETYAPQEVVPVEEEISSPEQRVAHILSESPSVMAILSVVAAQTDIKLWLSGGAVRNAVWDYLHGFAIPTPLEDVDVVWFDAKEADKAIDDELERRLALVAPNVRWDVKNQARMRDVEDRPYPASLEEAMRYWPEKASAVAVRLDQGKMIIIAPFGLVELLALQVNPAPAGSPDRYRQRIESKNWQRSWPNLTIAPPPLSGQ